jgi:2-keto-4-pentenoate hydratase
MVEFEIAFVLARDVVPTEPLPAPREVIGAVHTTFELVLSRFVDRRSVGFPSFVGDNVGFEALIVGDTIDIAQVSSVAPNVVVSVNGEERARGMSGENLTDPFAALGALMKHARERKVPLRRGDIVTTGANATPFEIPGDDAEIVARFAHYELSARTRAP